MLRQRNETSDPSKHGLAAGDAARPDRADWTIDQGWDQYTAEDHGVWKTLFERQRKLLVGRACDSFVRGMNALPMKADEISDFRRLSDLLMQRTGWQIVAVPGLVPDDVFHDVFGHVPLLLHPAIADYVQAYGVGGLRAHKLGTLNKLARVYWYTIEFGLVRQKEGMRIYGAGIASSATESVFALDDPSPNRVRLDLDRVLRTDYRIDDLQETYFVIETLDELLELAQIDFAPVYRRIEGLSDHAPGTVLDTDRLYARGTGQYHAAKRREGAKA